MTVSARVVTIPCRAVLLDMDGTLLDTESRTGPWPEAERRVADWLGFGYTADDAAMLFACTGLKASADYLRTRAGNGMSAVAVETRLAAELRYVITVRGVRFMPGAYALLTGIRAHGLPHALVTSTDRHVTRMMLDKTGMRFDAVIDAQSVTALKPDPEPYLAAAAALRVQPGDCVAVEDSPAGATSAQSAGCTVIVIPGPAQVTSRDGLVFTRSLDMIQACPQGLIVREARTG